MTNQLAHRLFPTQHNPSAEKKSLSRSRTTQRDTDTDTDTVKAASKLSESITHTTLPTPPISHNPQCLLLNYSTPRLRAEYVLPASLVSIYHRARRY